MLEHHFGDVHLISEIFYKTLCKTALPLTVFSKRKGKERGRGRGRVSNLGGNMIGKGSSGSCALLNSTLGCVSKHKEMQW